MLLLVDRIDAWMVDHLPEFEGKSFQDVGRGQLSLPEGDGEITQQVMNDENKPFLKKMRKILKGRVDTVNVSQRLVDSPACVVAVGPGSGATIAGVCWRRVARRCRNPKPILEINVDHPLVTRLSAETDDKKFDDLSNIVLDHALLADGTAPLTNPADYVRRMNTLLAGS